MLDRFAPDILAGVNQTLQGVRVSPTHQGGQEVAAAVVDVMRTVIETLSPMAIITAFDEANSREHVSHM